MPERSRTVVRRAAGGLACLVAVEFGLGVASLLRLPITRVTGLLPKRGGPIYLTHAVLGLPLAFLAMAYLFLAERESKTFRFVGRLGFGGIAIAGLGGLLATVHQIRVLGMFMMLGGALVALFAYMIPTLEWIAGDSREDQLRDEPAADAYSPFK